jgi:hypothetical protein
VWIGQLSFSRLRFANSTSTGIKLPPHFSCSLKWMHWNETLWTVFRKWSRNLRKRVGKGTYHVICVDADSIITVFVILHSILQILNQPTHEYRAFISSAFWYFLPLTVPCEA